MAGVQAGEDQLDLRMGLSPGADFFQMAPRRSAAVVSQAGATFRMGVDDMQRLIRDLGYEPKQRDNWYRLVNDAPAPVQLG